MKKTIVLLGAVLALALLSGTVAGAAEGTETAAVTEAAAVAVKEIDPEQFSYADLEGKLFEFSSGAGAWSTELAVYADGSFDGSYHDWDRGDTGDGYPDGTYYYCTFHGRFGELVRADAYSYRTTVEALTLDEPADTVTYADGAKNVASEPYGLEDAEGIVFYLPGQPTASLPEAFAEWVQPSLSDENGSLLETMDFVGLYNENAGDGFSSYDLDGAVTEGAAAESVSAN